MGCKLYLTQEDAFTVVEIQSIPDDTKPLIIEDLLEASAGTTTIDVEGVPTKVTAYRPYLVAAHIMHSSKNEQTLITAIGDAQFRSTDQSANLQAAIISNLRIQQSLDFGCGLQVPVGWDVQTLLDQFCGCLDDGKAVGLGGNYAFGAITA